MSTHAARIAEIDVELAAIRAARLKILQTGQAYMADGRQMTRVNFRDLRELETALENDKARLKRSGKIRTMGVVVR